MNELLPAPNISAALWRYRWSSLVIVAVTLLASVCVTLLTGNATAAQARIVLSSPASVEGLGIEITSESGFVRYVNQRALFVTSERTLGVVRDRLGGSMTVTELREAVTAEATDNGESIVVRVDVGDAERSTRIANAVVAAYRSESRADVQQAADEALRTLRARRAELVEGLTSGRPGSAELATAAGQTISELDSRTTDIRIAAAQFDDGVAFVDNAVPDSSGLPAALLRGVALGLAFGALLAGGVAWVRADRNRRVRDAADLARLSDEPLLGEIEALPDSEVPRLHNLVVPPLGSYQLVASVLRNTVRGGVVAVTGPEAGDGATTTVLQVAGAAARDGLRVLVVDAAVRTRELTYRVALDHDWYGLSAVATGAAPLRACTRVIEVGPGSEFRVIAAGRPDESTPEHFRSSNLWQAVGDLRGAYDLVLLDVPPLDSAPEISALVPAADAVVLAVSRDRSVASVRRTRERIRLLGGSVTGCLFTFARPAGTSATGPAPSAPYSPPRDVPAATARSVR